MKPLRVLIVEDSEKDAVLLLRELRKAGYSPVYTLVDSAGAMLSALEQDWDIVLADYVLPGFGGLDALKLAQQNKAVLPFIMISGQIGEDMAAEAMRAGAHDYIMKGNLKRLGPAIERELAEAENHRRRRQAEEELKRSEAELRALANRLVQIQEEERRNLARELHDEIGQEMTLLKLLLFRMQRSGDGAALAEAQEIVSRLLGQVRDLSHSLRPGTLDDLGLVPTLEWYLPDFARKSGIEISFDYTGQEEGLTPEVKTTAYRIIQEALTNVVRHAAASQVTVSLAINERSLALKVCDNGVGFDPALVSHKSSGLRGIRERACYFGGSLSLESSPGCGTSLLAELTLGNQEMSPSHLGE